MPWFELKGDERLSTCATEGCGGQQTWRLEAGGIGSNYCSGCKAKIEAFQIFTDEQNAKFRAQDALYNETMKTP